MAMMDDRRSSMKNYRYTQISSNILKMSNIFRVTRQDEIARMRTRKGKMLISEEKCLKQK
ncbi:MAG: hypothetical protein LBF97_06055 [Elusimicrobiota bacterium]|jgi:hypothetical protein|nr:hypothetical protein [Elusimicrobiota bacterium]